MASGLYPSCPQVVVIGSGGASAWRVAVNTQARDRLAHPDTAPRPGRPRTPPHQRTDKPPTANITDPDSTIMPTRNGWVQGYNVLFDR
ncbi:MAG: hypothetical protein ACRDTF_04710 [Pseudonocardiaceae bacterium]